MYGSKGKKAKESMIMAIMLGKKPSGMKKPKPAMSKTYSKTISKTKKM